MRYLLYIGVFLCGFFYCYLFTDIKTVKEVPTTSSPQKSDWDFDEYGIKQSRKYVNLTKKLRPKVKGLLTYYEYIPIDSTRIFYKVQNATYIATILNDSTFLIDTVTVLK